MNHMKLPRYRSKYPHHQFPQLIIDGVRVQLYCRAADLTEDEWHQVREYATARKRQQELLKPYQTK